jgi:hypothetical protein
MDTSAEKASTEEQKKKFCLEGCCFECKKQGYIVWNCPMKKTQVCSMEITNNQVKNQEQSSDEQLLYSVQEMITCTTKFMDKEKHIFIQGMCEEVDDHNLGFLEAGAKWP